MKELLNLSRPLVILDLETTGVDIQTDRIIQIGIIKVSPDGTIKEWEQLFNPGITIPKEASDVHGLTDELVKDKPAFVDMAYLILRGIQGCDLAGFNLKYYDMPLLAAEFERCGFLWTWKDHLVVDASVIMKKHEERTLSAAVKFYLDKSHDDAHGALPDCRATLEVILTQIGRYGLGNSVQDLDEESKYDGELDKADISGKLVYDADGDLAYNFGKNKGKKVKDDTGYALWMINKDFSREVVGLLEKELHK